MPGVAGRRRPTDGPAPSRSSAACRAGASVPGWSRNPARSAGRRRPPPGYPAPNPPAQTTGRRSPRRHPGRESRSGGGDLHKRSDRLPADSPWAVTCVAMGHSLPKAEAICRRQTVSAKTSFLGGPLPPFSAIRRRLDPPPVAAGSADPRPGWLPGYDRGRCDGRRGISARRGAEDPTGKHQFHRQCHLSLIKIMHGSVSGNLLVVMAPGDGQSREGRGQESSGKFQADLDTRLRGCDRRAVYSYPPLSTTRNTVCHYTPWGAASRPAGRGDPP